MEPFVKVCGLTNCADAEAAIAAGAAYLGFILVPASPRYVPPDQLAALLADLPRVPPRVGVFQDAPVEHILECMERLPLDFIQLHGDETPAHIFRLNPDRCWKMCPLDSASDLEILRTCPSALVLVDTVYGTVRGGAGRTGNWTLAAQAARLRPLVLAGGLRPENVTAAIRQVCPAGVDVSSGIEVAPGRKDLVRLRAFFEAVRG